MRLPYLILVLLPGLSYAAGPQWRPVHASLWAMQAAVPPGTNNMGGIQLVPGVVIPGTGSTPGSAVFPAAGAPPSAPGTPAVPGIPGVPRPAGGPGGPPPAPNTVGAPAANSSPAISQQDPPSSPAVTSEPACQVALSLTRMNLSESGGKFQVPVSTSQPNCPVSVAFSVPWVELIDPASLRFEAEANTTGSPREAQLAIGGRWFYLRQEAPPQSGFAAAPSDMAFGVDKDGRTSKQLLTVWSAESESLQAVAGHPWLSVTPKRGKLGRRIFEVTVREDAALPAGRYDSHIELSSSAAPMRTLTIPVVVEVFGLPD